MKFQRKSLLIRVILLLPVLLVQACTTSSSPNNIYVLETSALPELSRSLETNVIVIKDVVFADYISQTNLMIQTAKHRLSIARHHLWNEDLDVAFKRALLHDLNVDSPSLFVTDDLMNFDIGDTPVLEIHLKIEKAYPDSEGNVHLSGYYWLVGSERQKYYSHYDFTTELSEDGYYHAVSQLRFLVNSLATELKRKVSSLSG